MIKEKMLELMVLSEIFKTTSEIPKELESAYEKMWIRYDKIRDEFINQFDYSKTVSKNPVPDTKMTDA